MIAGAGTDILKISRMEKACLNERFITKNFTEPEIAYLSGKKAESYAGNFCCKEAAAKALGRGFSGFSPIHIEVLRDNNNAPYINFYGEAKKMADDMGVKRSHASISHDGQYAVAFVVLEK